MSKHKDSTTPLLGGILGGSASVIILYPLDLVKVRLQVSENSGVRKRSVINTFRGVVRHEGFRGLYQGLSPGKRFRFSLLHCTFPNLFYNMYIISALVASSVAWGGYFFFYEAIKKEVINSKKIAAARVQQKEGKEITLGPLENFFAASLSGSIMVGITNPMWLIKTRMQLQMKKAQEEQLAKLPSQRIKPPYRNFLDAAQTIIREEGFLALYKGTGPALMLVSNGAIQFVTYEFLKKKFGEFSKATGRENNSNNGVLERFKKSLGFLTMGAVSKTIASTMTYPIQLIKSRIQQRNQTFELSSTGELELAKREYKSMTDCATKIWRREGIPGFFRGCIPNALRVAPSSAITFLVYETVVDILSDDKVPEQS